MLLPPGFNPATDEMLTMRPEPLALRCGAAARQRKYGPRRLVAKSLSHTSGLSASRSGNGMLMFQAALLTRMSRRPKCLITDSTTDGIASALVWSSATLHARRPQGFDGTARVARGVLALEIGDRDIGARPGQRAVDGGAEETGTAGDESDLALELHDGGESITPAVRCLDRPRIAH